LAGGDERVEAGTGTDVDDTLAGLETAQRERVVDAGEGLDRSVRQRVDGRVLVAETGGERAPGVEVEGVVRVDRDLPVLVPYLVPERLRIDGQVVRHRYSSPAATGSPARFHSGKPSASLRARKPFRFSSRTASSA